MADPQPLAEGLTARPKSFREALSPSQNFHTQVDQQLKERSYYKGEPALIFSDEEINSLAAPFQFYLVGKFMGIRPSMEYLRKGFGTIGFSGEFQLGLLDEQHVLIRFSQQTDYHHCWMHGVWKFKQHTMKVLKWTPDFSFDREPPIVPVWVSFEKLPIHFFQKSPLLSLANLIGKPLKIDAATYNLTRPSVARVCVEINLNKQLPNRIWIGNGNFGFWQPVIYEDLPKYCIDCCCLGHTSGNCASASQMPSSNDKIWRPKKVKNVAQSGLKVANEVQVMATTNTQHQQELDRTVSLHPNSSGLTASEKNKIRVDVHDTSPAKKQTVELGPQEVEKDDNSEAKENTKSEHPQVLTENDNPGSEVLTNEAEKDKEIALESSKASDDTAPPLAIIPVMSETSGDGDSTNMDDELELEEDSDTVIYEEVIVLDKTGRLKLQLQPIQSDLNTPEKISPESPDAFPKSVSDVYPVPSAPSPAASPGEDGTSALVSLSAPAIVNSTVDSSTISTQDGRFKDDFPFQQPKHRGRKKKQPLGHRSTQIKQPTVASFTLLPED